MSPLLIVADLNGSIEFYTKKLGFELDFCYEGFYAGIIKDGHSIHLKLGKPFDDERQNRKRYISKKSTFKLVSKRVYFPEIM